MEAVHESRRNGTEDAARGLNLTLDLLYHDDDGDADMGPSYRRVDVQSRAMYSLRRERGVEWKFGHDGWPEHVDQCDGCRRFDVGRRFHDRRDLHDWGSFYD